MAEDKIGAGAFSTIYKSTHAGRDCAIKYGKGEDLLREIEILKILQNSKYCVKMLDYKADSPKGFIKYELLDRRLFDALDDLNEPDVERIAHQLLCAIHEIHDNDIIHGDIKPENIMLDFDGNIRIIDFDDVMYKETKGDYTGTLHYRPPEYVIAAKIDKHVDFWAYGCVIMELLIGNVLFGPRRDNNMYAHAALLGVIKTTFGEFDHEFLQSGIKTGRYFDVSNGYTFKFEYLMTKKRPLYEILMDHNYSEERAHYWHNYLMPFFDNGRFFRAREAGL